MKNITINTKIGEIIGIDNDTYQVFQGIPYATTKRFQDPSVYVIEGPFDATNRAVDVYQQESFIDNPTGFYAKEFGGKESKQFTEDFVTLTITTPNVKGKYPVFVFIHGGGFEGGSVDDLPYSITDEYAKRKIVLVSLGYRVSALSCYKGENLGLKDMLFGINWVKDNIEDFGGDSTHIVIGGQSAGAMSINDLCYSKQLEGIIKGIIMMSGAGRIPSIVKTRQKEDTFAFWENVEKKVGNIHTCEVKELFKAYNETIKEMKFFMPSLPGIDGITVTDNPKILEKEKKILNVPVLVGCTSQDMFPILIFDMALKWGLNNSNKAYGYFFDKTPPGNSYKAFHAVDLWYAFGNLDKSWRGFEKIDNEISTKMINYFANFIKYQDPNGDNLPEWKQLSNKQKCFFNFDEASNSMIKPSKCRRKLLHSFLFDRGPL